VTGPFSEAELASLDAAVDAVLESSAELAPYREFVRWRIDHVPGYRELYRRLIGDLDRRARETHARAFVGTDARTRVAVFEETLAPCLRWKKDSPPPAVDEVPADPVARAAQYHEFFRAEILAIYSTSDALVALGYEAGIGVPRGFADYQHAPQSVR
jgi:hypothetical protein